MGEIRVVEHKLQTILKEKEKYYLFNALERYLP